MSSAVFVAIFAEFCGHCTTFKTTHLEKLKEELAKKQYLQTEYITLTDQASKVAMLQKYPRDLQNYLFWFPMFILFTRKSWNACAENPNSPLEGVIFNGPPDAMKKPLTAITPTADNLVKWIDEQLATNHIFKQPNPARNSRSNSSRSSSMKLRRNLIT